jgi:UDP-glucose:tetrahydrobiopterin glucosyltransferase
LRTLRVALLAPLVSPIREPQIGGVATLLTDLALGLAGAGCEVDVFAASGSRFDGLNIIDTGVDAAGLAATLVRPMAGPAPPDEEGGGLHAAREAFRSAYAAIGRGGYDVVHSHAFDAPAIELGEMVDAPVVQTLHLPPDPRISQALSAAAGRARPPTVAAVSRSQRRGWERHARVDVLLQAGVPTDRIGWSAHSAGPLLFAGRLSPEKGVLDAIEIAALSGRPLVVAGGRYDPAYADEVEHAARRLGRERVILVGALPREELWRRMAAASALLFPIRWEEPFGMVTAEAQAAGCPVIGFGRGALGDVVLDGVTGAIVAPGDLQGAAGMLEDLGHFDRSACRRHAEDHLDAAPMVRDHLILYRRLAGLGGP